MARGSGGFWTDVEALPASWNPHQRGLKLRRDRLFRMTTFGGILAACCVAFSPVRACTIFFLFLPERAEAVSLNLLEELKRGPHRYDMLKIDEQKARKPKRLSRLMEWMKIIFCPLRYSRPVALGNSLAGTGYPEPG